MSEIKTVEEFKDFYTEESFSIRDSEVQFKLKIGEALAEVKDLKPYAKAIKKHVSFLETCIGVYKKWPELEKTYTKEKSWNDLVKLAGLGEKRARKPIKNLIRERLKKNEERFKQTGDMYVKGRYDEDEELLTKGDEK